MSRASVGVFTPHLDAHIGMAWSLQVQEFVAMDVPVVVRTSIIKSLFSVDEVAKCDDRGLPRMAALRVRMHQDLACGTRHAPVVPGR